MRIEHSKIKNLVSSALTRFLLACFAKVPAALCPRLDSNQHTLSGATTSKWCVYQFRHPGIEGCKNSGFCLYLEKISNLILKPQKRPKTHKKKAASTFRRRPHFTGKHPLTLALFASRFLVTLSVVMMMLGAHFGLGSSSLFCFLFRRFLLWSGLGNYSSANTQKEHSGDH